MLMILLIARRDKCDLIFRRQLLSCFVSLRSFQKADNNYSAELSSFFFSFLTREERTKHERNKMTSVLWRVYQKLFLLLEEGFCFFEHLTLQWNTHSQFPKLFNTSGMDAMITYTAIPKKKQKNMKVKVIVIDMCTAFITFCTEKNQAPVLLKQ